MAIDAVVTQEDAAALLAQLKDVQPILEKFAAAKPPVSEQTQAPAPAQKDVSMTYEQVIEARERFVRTPPADLYRMIGLQLRKGSDEGYGVPFTSWANDSVRSVMANEPMLVKLIDTSGGVALIRQDLEPLLYAAFVQEFPWFARIPKEPSNGLVHAFNRVDSPPTAAFITELGVVGESQSVYTRATTNIAVAAVQVGTSLKAQFAVRQGGAGYNPEQEEIRNGVTGLANLIQFGLFQGNASVPLGVATDVDGLYDANAFDGLRISVPGNPAGVGVNDGRYRHIAAAETILEALNIADGLKSVTGGKTSVILMDARDRVTMMNELQPHVRFLPQQVLVPGLPQVAGVTLGNSGDVPVVPIPGAQMGSYTAPDASTVRDAYLVDERTVSMPWLGSESPTILEIPVGVAGVLSKLYILFMMAGFAVKVPNNLGGLRITQ